MLPVLFWKNSLFMFIEPGALWHVWFFVTHDSYEVLAANGKQLSSRVRKEYLERSSDETTLKLNKTRIPILSNKVIQMWFDCKTCSSTLNIVFFFAEKDKIVVLYILEES